MVHIYDDLLRSATLDDAPHVRWARIGTEADGYSFDVARIGNLGDVVYRAGKQALIDDQVTTAPDNRERVAGFVTKMEAVAREQSAFFIGRLFRLNTSGFIRILLGQGYAGAGKVTVDQVMSANLPDYEELDLLRGLFRTENLLPKEASFAAYVSAMNHTFEGMNYPIGGYRTVSKALIPTIQASGGKVFTKAHIKQITLDKAGKRAVGVVMENGQEIHCTKSVICSTGVVPLFTQYLPKVPLPVGLDAVEEARPRLYTLVLLKGSPEELELPASDYYQVPTEDTAGMDWYGGRILKYQCLTSYSSSITLQKYPPVNH